MRAGAADGRPLQEGDARSWTAGPRQPALAPSAIDVWRVDLTATGERVVGALSAQERERAERIAGPSERRLWSRSRGVLRDLLGRYLAADPSSLELVVGAQGKPLLAAPWSERGLHFNLSHSGELALYAFAARSAVGVDVELLHEPGRGLSRDRIALASRLFDADTATRLAELPPRLREHEFLRVWTRHEAELKRRGTGIGASSAEEHADGEAHAESWIVELDVGRRAVAALAAEPVPADELRLCEWT